MTETSIAVDIVNGDGYIKKKLNTQEKSEVDPLWGLRLARSVAVELVAEQLCYYEMTCLMTTIIPVHT